MILDPPESIERWRAAGWWGTTTIDDLFRGCVRRHPARIALLDAPNRAAFAPGPRLELSFAGADRAVDRLAATLLAAGVGRGDIVLVQLPNIVEIVLAFLACARLGAIVSPVLLAYGDRDLRRIAAHLRPAAWLTLDRFREERPARRAATLIAEPPVRPGRPTAVLAFGAADHPGVLAVPSLASAEADTDTASEADRDAIRRHLAQHPPDANDIVTMHWTSGTSGDPKCVPRSHNSWHATGGCCTDAGGLQPGERILAPMQMVHTAGYSGMFMPWLETAGLLALHQPFDMAVFLDQIEALRINHTVAAPAMLNALLRSGTLENRDVSSLRSILCGSAPLDAWMIEGFKRRHGIEIVNAFGSTEGLTLASGPSNAPDPRRRARWFPRFRGAASAVPGLRIAAAMETRLRDPETGALIEEPLKPGELYFRSPALFPGYWTAEGALDRGEFDADGFFRAGEIFEIAGDGADRDCLHYIDRVRDVINRGGVKIPVGELESAIQNQPQVREAAAIGYPDEILGERICAVVALVPDASLELGELIDALRAEGLARYLLPERLEIVAALPRNVTGKVLKRDLVRTLGARTPVRPSPSR